MKKWATVALIFALANIAAQARADGWNENELGTSISNTERFCPQGTIPLLGQNIDTKKFPSFTRMEKAHTGKAPRRTVRMPNTLHRDKYLYRCLITGDDVKKRDRDSLRLLRHASETPRSE